MMAWFKRNYSGNTSRTTKAYERQDDDYQTSDTAHAPQERKAMTHPKFISAVQEGRREYTDWKTKRVQENKDRAQKKFDAQSIKTEREGRKAIKRLQEQSEVNSREGRLSVIKAQKKEVKEATKELKRHEREYKHPTYTHIKETAREKARKYGGEAYEAGARAKARGKKIAIMGGKAFAESSGTTYLGAYNYGQRRVRRTADRNPLGQKGAGKKSSTSTRRPVNTPTTMSLSDRISMESNRPSMFQSDLTKEGSSREQTFNNQPSQGIIGLGIGIGARRDYIGSGKKLTGMTTKRNGNGLGILQTTKKKEVRYY